MIEVCGNSLACQYDFALTFDPECAKVTRDEELAARWFQNEAHRKGKHRKTNKLCATTKN